MRKHNKPLPAGRVEGLPTNAKQSTTRAVPRRLRPDRDQRSLSTGTRDHFPSECVITLTGIRKAQH
jgi:hypothetical protein